MTDDGRWLTIGALGLLAGSSMVASGSKGVVRRGQQEPGRQRKDAMPNQQVRERISGLMRDEAELHYPGANAVHKWFIGGDGFRWSDLDLVWKAVAPTVWRALWNGIVEDQVRATGEWIVVVFKPDDNTYGEVWLMPSHPDSSGRTNLLIKVQPDDENDDPTSRAGPDTFEASPDEAGFDRAMSRIVRRLKTAFA